MSTFHKLLKDHYTPDGNDFVRRISSIADGHPLYAYALCSNVDKETIKPKLRKVIEKLEDCYKNLPISEKLKVDEISTYIKNHPCHLLGFRHHT